MVRLVGADDQVYPNFLDVMQYLADSDLLEMIVDKLNPSVSNTNFGYFKIKKGLEAFIYTNLVNRTQSRKVLPGFTTNNIVDVIISSLI